MLTSFQALIGWNFVDNNKRCPVRHGASLARSSGFGSPLGLLLAGLANLLSLIFLKLIFALPAQRIDNEPVAQMTTTHKPLV